MNFTTILLMFATGLPVAFAVLAVSRTALLKCFRMPPNLNTEKLFRPFFGIIGILFAMSAILTVGCAGPVTKAQTVSPALAAVEKARQEQIAFDTLESRQKRLSAVSFPIQRAAAPLCGEHTRFRGGFQTASRFDYDQPFRDAAVKRHGLSGAQQVLWVDSNSPAYHAGLKSGDILVSADGTDFPAGRNAEEKWSKIYSNAVKDGAVYLAITRGDRSLTVHMKPDKVCAYDVLLMQDDSVNAFADGEKVHITSGMMRFTETDQELALVVAHEIAHNAMRHIDKQQRNRIGGAIAEGLISGLACAYGGVCGLRTGMADAAARAFSKEFEAESDYVGLYIMARAGMEIEGAADFWRRMAAEYPANIATNHTATHPSSPERFLAMEQTIEEIKRKKSEKSDLMPDFKE